MKHHLMIGTWYVYTHNSGLDRTKRQAEYVTFSRIFG